MDVPLFLEFSGKVECRATFQNPPAIRLSGYQREILARLGWGRGGGGGGRKCKKEPFSAPQKNPQVMETQEAG